MEEKPWFKFYPEGLPTSIDYPNISITEALKEVAEKYPNDIALIFEDFKLTYRELVELVDRFATALSDLGISKGDIVALFLPNIPQFAISYYGALEIGAIVTAVNPLFKEKELEYQLNNSEAKTIVALDVFYPLIRKVKNRTKLESIIITSIKEYLPAVKRVLGTLLKKIPSLKVPRDSDVYFFQELLKKYPPNPPKVEINPKEDIAVLQYTGGTTGIPKGAILTHYNLLSNAIASAYWGNSDLAKEAVKEGVNVKDPRTFREWIRKRRIDVTLAVLPWFHIYGMTVTMNGALLNSGTVVVLPRFDPVKVLKTIEKYKVTLVPGVPTMYAALINHPKISKYDISSVRYCVSGAAPLPPEIQRKFMQLTGGVLIEGYGLTEASPVTHANPPDPTLKTVKIGTIGIPFPDTDAKIVDLETGTKELKPGEIGELVIKGPQVMKGYWKMPEETKATLRNGWLYTGDIATMDENGYFRIVDRKKDLIKYKGYSVYPRELEDILYEHPAVKLCCVVGIPDPEAGEIPKAFIVLKEEYVGKISEEDIIEWVKERVAPYKRIRKVEFREELPTSAVGKVLRRLVREEARKTK